jgi:hypothetical protein
VRCTQVWDGVLDTSRDMLRAIVACEPLLGGPFRARRLLDLTCAYAVLLEEFVTGEPRDVELHRLCLPKDIDALAAAPPGSNRPLVMTELLAEEVVRTARSRPEFANSPHYSRILSFIDELGALVCGSGRRGCTDEPGRGLAPTQPQSHTHTWQKKNNQ